MEYSTTRPQTRRNLAVLPWLLSLLPCFPVAAATLLVWPDSPNSTPPYADWGTAAQTLQAAVEAAQPGDTILATNGIYSTGGRVVYGSMTNRVAVTKPVTVQSVNGPEVTVIQGYQVPGTTNGEGAIRCVYLTNGAVLSGFTLTNGATRRSGEDTRERSGGGVWCESTAGLLLNCTLAGNGAYLYGGAAYQGNLSNCTLAGNVAYDGGGTYRGTLNNCTLVGNAASGYGGGSYSAALNNCAIMGNSAGVYGGGASIGMLNNCTLVGNAASTNGGGAYNATLNNCILYYNTAPTRPNYSIGTLNYCCTTPLPGSGLGHTAAEPQLASGSHLSSTSPCRGAGNSAYAKGLDLDGEAWLTPPSIGCDEYHPGAVTGPLTVAIAASASSVRLGFAVDFTALIKGRMTASAWAFQDGTVVSNRPCVSHAWSEPGNYTVVLWAYNESSPEGVSAAVTIRVLAHCVSPASPNPVPPYASWDTAARTIQEAVDASLAGDVVLVTNGIYSTGSRSVYGLMTNRLAVTKPVIVQSVNGPGVTIIEGCPAPGTTNGDGAIRCVYLTNGAVLNGFTLTHGATRTTGDALQEESGGGVWCESTNVLITNCTFTGNSAANGGGAYQGTLNHCTFTGNSAWNGAGSYLATLNNCLLTRNTASAAGGATCYGTANNCTLTGNSAAEFGGGAYSNTLNNCFLAGNSTSSVGGGACAGTLNNCTLTRNSAAQAGGAAYAALNNCILYDNTANLNANYDDWFGLFGLNYCCTTPDPGRGAGNVSADPQFASASHLSAASPCRGAGNAAYAQGLDIDGETWLTPPSIGCDEYRAGTLTGPLAVAIDASRTSVSLGFVVDLTAVINGRVTASVWDLGDGIILSNRPNTSRAWDTEGDFPVVLRAFNEDHPGGLSATVTVRVAAHPVVYVATSSTNPIAPYTSWETAARTLQDAADAALPNSLVLVSDGVYATGGRALPGLITNRLAVTKPMVVQSVNGPEVTIIQGDQAPGMTNGDGAIRCVYLGSGALLSGFTLTNGGTGASGEGGGGVHCESGNALVTNCTITGNWATNGGGAYSGALYNCNLTGNSAQAGGGASASTLNHCSLTGNWASLEGGGASGCTANYCTFSGNSAENGGGAISGALDHCTLTGNSAWNGAGTYQAMLNNCVLGSNSASYSGAGACYGTLNNCVLTGNSAESGGGTYAATLNNCTLTGNSAETGGGAHSATLYNCILYYNTANDGPNYFGGTINYCCTTPSPGTGLGNISAEPLLTDLSHLCAGSPCRGAGNAAFASWLDIDGEPWLNPPSIGCDEYWPGPITGPLAVMVEASWTHVAVGFSVDLRAWINGRAGANAWDFGDGTGVSNRPYASHSWDSPGEYVVSFWAYSDSAPDGVRATLAIRVVAPPVHCVAIASANPAPPYISWDTAARTIQEAVDAANLPGALVLVSNGIYATGGRAVYGLMTNRVALDKPVTVQSIGGPGVTAIQGYQVPGTTNGDGAIRCVYLTNGAILSGFTLTHGATRTAGNATREQSGGGVWCESVSALVTNCELTGNSAPNGGGACQGTLNSCRFAGNSGWNGGGAYGATLIHCTLMSNSVSYAGGGACSAWLNECVLTGNLAQFGGGASDSTLNYCRFTANDASNGGGAYAGTLNNCILIGNLAWNGGGAYGATLNNCVLTSNRVVSVGGGTCYGTLNNCTLTGNWANAGGGAFSGTLNNCLVYYNISSDGTNYYVPQFYGITLNYCCTTPDPGTGTGNITADPQLASIDHLSAGSPCRGAGSAAFASGMDIDGEPWLDSPSIGCDEYWARNLTGPLSVDIGASKTYVRPGFAVDLTAWVSGRVTASSWDMGDGTVLSNRPYASHAWSAPGEFLVVLWAYNESHPDGVSATVLVQVAAQPVHYVSATSANPVSPYNSWATAARGLQEAVDVAIPGALVLATNGIYSTGGRAVYGGMTNRVVVDKALTLQSVNGPEATIIQGWQVPGTTNGEGAIRCVYLTNGAILRGFILTNGATRAAGDPDREESGGGVWCESTSALITNCTFAGNSAANGGGAYSGTLNNCTFTGNTAWNGGGAYRAALNHCVLAGNRVSNAGGAACYVTLNNCTLAGNQGQIGGGTYGNWETILNNCTLTGNMAETGGGTCYGTLNNCTLTDNRATSTAGGTYESTLNNCLLYYNMASSAPNYDSFSRLNYCCTTPDPGSGTGNITAEPQLSSSSHISAGSPCRGAGSADYATGVDIDGESWLTPPSIGCDEYRSGAVTGPLAVTIGTPWRNVAAGFALDLTGWISGQVTASVWDTGDGTVLSNRPYASHAWWAEGVYPVVLRAYNESHPEGVSATVMVQVLEQPVHYVAMGSANPLPPYNSWDTAARNIQDAVDVAEPGGLVLVSNGVYSTGGRTVYGLMTNRVVVDRPLTVQSVNGPEETIIRGYQTPELTNGDGAIRCVYLANGGVLSGFTLTNGATRALGDKNQEQSGGGVWCESINALVTNCLITANTAFASGGGVCNGTFKNCTLTSNWAQLGGGVCQGTLNQCILQGNSAGRGGGAYAATLNNSMLTGNTAQVGGGTEGGILNNCTLTGNAVSGSGGGAYNGVLRNCILYYNTANDGHNYCYGTSLNYCCTTPDADGPGNISADPQLASTSHLSASSPCRGAGSPAYVTDADIDGEPWLNPPSIGCDEYRVGTVSGPLAVAIGIVGTNVIPGISLKLTGWISGRVVASVWDFGDGTILSNQPYASHAWGGEGNYPVGLRAYNETHPEGVSATVMVRVLPQPVHYVASASTNPAPPYSSWDTAACTIQEAVDVASPGALVLVTNGIYSTGGRAVCGLMTNRLVVTKPVTVRSVNGPGMTFIQGYQVPGATNGDGAIRCVYLTNGSVLSGFTLTSGATRMAGDAIREESGGGVWCESTNVLVTNCIFTGNSAPNGGGACAGTLQNCAFTGNWAWNGGGAYQATLNNCVLTRNSVSYAGGGACFGTLNNCTLTDNVAGSGGGAYSATLNNSVLYYNTDNNGSNALGCVFNYCCTTPSPGIGLGNITNEPLFVDRLNGDLRLQSNSPCIDSGNNAYVSGSFDLDGKPRIARLRVDMGAYEYQGPGMSPFIAWLQQFGLPTDGSADDTDPDGDGLSNWQEWRCGTDPTNALSVLRLLPPTNSLSGVVVTWESVANRAYSLDRSTNLGVSPAFLPLATGIAGQPGATSFMDTNAPIAGPCFYRVGTPP